MKLYRQIKCSDRLPAVDGEYYCVIANGKCGNYYFDGNKFESSLVIKWLEEIEIPSEEEVIKEFTDDNGVIDTSGLFGVNFILNKTKQC